MGIERWREERMAVLEGWEAALSAYQLEVGRHVSEGLRQVIHGLPCPRRPVDHAALERLRSLRAAEEAAFRRYAEGYPIRTASIDTDPSSNPSTGNVTGSPSPSCPST
jgi:hypothetical protein